MPQDPRIQQHAANVDAIIARFDSAHAGIEKDVADALALVEALQATAGQVTDEDAALIDQTQAKLEAAVAKLEALDAANPKPPTPPV